MEGTALQQIINCSAISLAVWNPELYDRNVTRPSFPLILGRGWARELTYHLGLAFLAFLVDDLAGYGGSDHRYISSWAWAFSIIGHDQARVMTTVALLMMIFLPCLELSAAQVCTDVSAKGDPCPNEYGKSSSFACSRIIIGEGCKLMAYFFNLSFKKPN